MPTQKIYAGVSLRETRSRAGLTQRAFADRLGVSLPYLSQMENNHRPVSAGVLLRLASEFSVDLGAMAVGDADRMVLDMAEALADPLFDAAPPRADLRLAATNACAIIWPPKVRTGFLLGCPPMKALSSTWVTSRIAISSSKSAAVTRL